MVHLDKALKAEKKHFFMGLSRAKDIFFQVASAPPGEEDPVINFEQFIRLIALLLKESNAEASKHNEPGMPNPSRSDLRCLFKRMDTNNSNTIDEYEYIALYKAVKSGHVKGLGRMSYHFYSKPTQLMQYGERDYHPNTDWQDLFFDLLFVGGAYQIGNFLVNGLVDDNKHRTESIFWAFCIFSTLSQQWLMKILLGSRFSHTSMFHYLLDNVEFILLAFAMWHIPASPLTIQLEEEEDTSYSSYGDDSMRRFLAIGSSLDYSSDYRIISCLDQLKDNVHGRTGGFSLSLALVSLLYIYKWLEIFFDDSASIGAHTLAKYQTQGYVATFCIFMLAYIMADVYSEYVMWIWIISNCAFIGNLFRWLFFLQDMDATGRVYEAGVPMNAHYFIQRVGEFCMLIIGESVLSLLALSVEADHENYLMFGASAMIACNLYFHHFSTYPSDPSKHVLRDGFHIDGCCYIIALIYFYPFCVVFIGVCLKALLAQADNNGPITFLNEDLIIGLICEYALINIFVFIHFQSRLEEKQWKPFATPESTKEFIKCFILQGLSVFLVLALAWLGLEPYPMIMSCCGALLIQSFFSLHFHQLSDAEEEDEDELEIALMDFNYQSSKIKHHHKKIDHSSENEEMKRESDSTTLTSVSDDTQLDIEKGIDNLEKGTSVDSYTPKSRRSDQGNDNVVKGTSIDSPSRSRRYMDPNTPQLISSTLSAPGSLESSPSMMSTPITTGTRSTMKKVSLKDEKKISRKSLSASPRSYTPQQNKTGTTSTTNSINSDPKKKSPNRARSIAKAWGKPVGTEQV